jgi:hypothetical protein
MRVPGEDLFLGAPQGETWPLGIDTVEPLLRQRFPEAIINRRTSAVTGKNRLSFAIPFADGIQRHGIYVDHDNLALSDGTGTDWADTIAWFLNLLPAGTPTVVMRGEGPDVVPLPSQIRTPEGVAAFFASLS